MDPVELTQEQLIQMKVHENANLGNFRTVLRVVGGWIYTQGFVCNDNGYDLMFTSTFVPEPLVKS